jgi:hypothetical protein
VLQLGRQTDPGMLRTRPDRAGRCWKLRIAESAYGHAYLRGMAIGFPVEARPTGWTKVGSEFPALCSVANVDTALPEDSEAIALIVRADTEHGPCAPLTFAAVTHNYCRWIPFGLDAERATRALSGSDHGFCKAFQSQIDFIRAIRLMDDPGWSL